MTDSAPHTPVARTGALTAIDRLLRGGYTDAEALREGRVALPVRTLIPLCLALGAFYGASMGLYSALSPGKDLGWLQVITSGLKVPLLFLLTLGVTFPSLYVVSALARSRLAAADTLRLLLAAIAVHLALLASLGPVAAFFTLSTDSYPFIKLMHAVFFAGSGVVGLGVLLRALGTILGPVVENQAPTAEAAAGDTPEPAAAGPSATAPAEARPDVDHMTPYSTGLIAARDRQRNDSRIRMVFRYWMLIYGCVAAQMGWILRPFIGAPDMDFSLFRDRESNFVYAFFRTLVELFTASS